MIVFLTETFNKRRRFSIHLYVFYILSKMFFIFFKLVPSATTASGLNVLAA